MQGSHTRTGSLLAVFLAATLLAAQEQAQPSPARQFEQAVTLMDAKAEYAGAARLFEQVAEASDRALAARALVYLGHCLERLGDAKAGAVYRRVMDAFPDQAAAVADARARLRMLEPDGSAVRPAPPTLRALWEKPPLSGMGIGLPSHDGRFLPFVDRTGSVTLAELTTGRLGPPVPINAAEGSLPGCALEPGLVLSPDGTQVVFACQPDGSDLYELRIASTRAGRPASRRLLAAAAGEAIGALAWSAPDTLLVQLHAADGAARLAVMSASGVVRRLVHLVAPAGKASLSPDGRWIVFDGPAEPGSANIDVFIAPVPAGPTRHLVEGPFHDRTPLWTPDGRGIVFVTDRTGPTSLWYQPVANGRAEGTPTLLFPDLGRVPLVLALTRSGRFLYFRETGLVDVYVADLGAEGLAITAPINASTRRIGQNLMPAWSPDGARLAYVSRERGIVIRDMAAESERALASGLTGAVHPRWRPSGDAIVVRAWDQLGRYGIYMIDVESGDVSALRIVAGTEESFLGMARWAHDGRAVVYAFGRDVMRMDVETGEERVLHSWSADLAGRFCDMSPVDDAMLFVLRERATASASLAVLTPDGTMHRLLDSRPREEFGQAVWTPDARGVVFGRISTDEALPGEARGPFLWRLDLATKAVHPLGLELDGQRDPAVAPDGRRVAFTAGWPMRQPWVLENFLPAPPARPQMRR